MGRVVFAWEFGGGLGHIENILPVAKTLRERGHDVVCIMKYVIDSENILGQYDIKVLQAPVFPENSAKFIPNTCNYSQNLYNLGYHVEDGLAGMVKAWQNLFELARPDVLIADHAPTALLAARNTPVKKILYGPGYFAPPLQSPLPSLTPWVDIPEDRLRYFDDKVLQIINAALLKLGKPLLETVADLFDVDENILSTFKELDHYVNREPARYWGPVISLAKGAPANWPAHSRKKIFCYLKPENPHFNRLLPALKEVAAAVIIYAPNMPGETAGKFQAENLVFRQEPLNMHNVCEECDLVICHAGHGTTALALLHGKPVLVFPHPNHLEQVLTSRNVAAFGAGGAVINVPAKRDTYRKAVLKVLSEPHFLAKARQFAERYRDFSPEKQIAEIADRFEEIMNQDAQSG